MSYADTLADLKADFGKKKLLTPAEIAPYISRTAGAQATMRSRKRFPVAKKDMGGRVVVSIYALARYIGEDDEEDAPKPAPTAKAVKATAKSAKGIDKSKPIRRPPSLAKTLTAMRKRIEDTALQLQFQQSLFSELEAIALDQATLPGKGNRARAIAKSGRTAMRKTIDD